MGGDRRAAPDVSGVDLGTDEGSTATYELRVGGMDWASCAAAIERSLSSLAGVQDVNVDVVGGRVRVAYADGKVAHRDLAGAIRRVGYTVLDDTTMGTSGRDAARARHELPDVGGGGGRLGNR